MQNSRQIFQTSNPVRWKSIKWTGKRTYNFPQGRVTDHRIGLTVYNLDSVLNGDIQEFLEALQFAENAEKLTTQK